MLRPLTLIRTKCPRLSHTRGTAAMELAMEVSLSLEQSRPWVWWVRCGSCSSHRKVSSSHSCRNAPPPSLSQILHYTKHTNFLFHSNINTRWNAERNIFLLSSDRSMLLRVAAVYLRHKESKTWRNVVLGVSGLLTSYLSLGSTQVVFWLLWSIK